MKRSEIKAGEFYINGFVDQIILAGPGRSSGTGHYDDTLYDRRTNLAGGSVLVDKDKNVTLADPPPWFAAQWVSRDAMIAVTTKILAAINFGDVDEAKSDLRNLLEQLKKGAENE